MFRRNPPRPFGVLATLLLFACSVPVFPQSSNPQTTAAPLPVLEMGKLYERALAGGESHSYQITLEADRYLTIEVDQRGIDIVVLIFDPNGKKVGEVDGFRVGDIEAVSFVSEIPGQYRYEIRSSFAKVPGGSYQLKIKELRIATERDKTAFTGGRLVAEAFVLERQQTQEAARKALDKYQQALQCFRSLKDIAWEANLLYLMATVYMNLGEKDKAFDFANQALPLAQAASKRSDKEEKRQGMVLEAHALNTLGRIHNEFGDRKKAIDLFNQALVLRRSLSDRYGEVSTLNNLAMSYQYMGDYRESLDYLKQARTLLKALGDKPREAFILGNICVVHNDLGEYKEGLENCKQSLAMRRDLNDPLGEAIVLNNMGSSYGGLGAYQDAEEVYTQSEALYSRLQNLQGQGIQFNNLGWLYGTLGDYQKAIDFYNKSLEIFRQRKDQYREGNVLHNIAANYADLGDYRKALDINQEALKLRTAAKNNDAIAVSLNSIGGCYSHLGEKQKALEYYKQSISLQRSRDPNQLASALRNIGLLYHELDDAQSALDSLNEALQVSRKIGDVLGEAAALSTLARVERDRGKLSESKTHLEAALAAVESVRINLKSQHLRTSFFASVRTYHELYIDVLMRLHKESPAEGFDVAALRATENARARSLLELLMEGNAQITHGVDPNLIEREKMLRQAISSKAELQLRLLRGKHTEEQVKSIAADLDTLTNQYELVKTQIRKSSPRYAALTQPVPLSLKEIQSSLLDHDTLLLEYAIGEDASFVWAITPTTFKTFALPKRSEIEKVARLTYDLLTASDRVVPNETLEERRKRLDQAESDYTAAATLLSQILLGPVASELKNKRLLIVGEGVTQYVPFSALPEPSSQGTPGQPLIVNHQIINLPSASVLSVLRRETKDRPRPTKSVAVFADPVFETKDPRFAVNANHRVSGNTDLSQAAEVRRSAGESGLQGFPRLRFSRQEAEQILRFAPRNSSLEALDFAANRNLATGAELKQYRIVHFATHGLINSRHAELSGVVLSLVNQQGEPQNGFLRLYDIYNMNLNAELVVLSACQTALGKDIKGEGLIGLTRAFMYAGAPRVVASLWQTEDRATSVFMSRFYEGVLGEGMSPAAALRNAQISMLQDKRWRQPRYWAAFTLQGEWK